jgi:hypothetical protein
VNITPAVTVAVENAGGNVVTTDNSTQVTLAITSGTGTTGAVLSGTKTVTVAAGVATFSNLNINLVGTGYTLTASSSPSYTAATSSGFNITAVNNGGGGGGGGGGGIPSPTTSGVTNVSNYVNAQGVFNQMISIWSDDLEGVVTVPSGTTGLTASGATLTQISFIHMTSPPAFQTGAGMIGLAYDITPNGITFNAAVSLEITYNPSSIPSGINPSSLQITYYDTTQNAWVTIPSTINTDHNYILAQISHFTSYAVTYGVKAITPTPTTTTTTITLPPVATTTPLTTTNTTTTTTVTTTTPIQTTTTTTPLVTTTTPITTSLTATFEASALSINPSTVKPNENVTINLKLTNTGNVSGTDTVILQINNSAVGSQIITLDRGASTVVIFTTNGIANGKYTVQVAGLNGNFSVSKNMSPTLFWVITIDAFLLVIILVIGLVLWRKRAS